MTNLHEIASASSDESVKRSTLMVMEPDSKLGSKYGLRRSLPVVVIETKENVFLTEVYTLPTIFTYGNSQDEALSLLLESLIEYSSELESTSGENMDIIKFGRFLKDLFNA